jgi:hypothetical protein
MIDIRKKREKKRRTDSSTSQVHDFVCLFVFFVAIRLPLVRCDVFSVQFVSNSCVTRALIGTMVGFA